MQRRLVLGVLAILIGSGLIATGRTVYAGGWALVTLDSNLPRVEAGVPFTFGFMVRQHGVRPIDGLAPKVEAWSSGVKERIKTTAKPEGETGHYIATLTLPTAGEWQWQIEAFGPIATLSPLQVAAPVASTASVAPFPGIGRPGLLLVGGLLVAVGLAMPFIYSRRRRPGLAA